jgi:peptidoglycan-N-acetylglucosamine deacetylase
LNILTFDIEEWYTYGLYPKGGRGYYLPIIENCLDKILNALEEMNIHATFFCLGIVARTDPQIIKKIFEHGHEISCHSDLHLKITQMTPGAFKEDTHKAIDCIEQLIGEKVKFYRAPAFSITESTKWALETLIEEGIICDSSIFPAQRRFGGFPSFNEMQPSLIKVNGKFIKEFPINYVSLLKLRLMFSGGGYFRILPYWFIKDLTSQSNYNMSYFHVRDFDYLQKRVFNRYFFISYLGINSALNKFNKYIKDFDFVSMGTAIEQINWQAVPKVLL